jgi:hypothetical protein
MMIEYSTRLFNEKFMQIGGRLHHNYVKKNQLICVGLNPEK